MTAQYINDWSYIQLWTTTVNQCTAANPDVPPPPAHLIRRHGRPRCPICWDTGLCAECTGQYPQYCPAQCDDGTCPCAAGRARRAAYRASLKEFGLNN